MIELIQGRVRMNALQLPGSPFVRRTTAGNATEVAPIEPIPADRSIIQFTQAGRSHD